MDGTKQMQAAVKRERQQEISQARKNKRTRHTYENANIENRFGSKFWTPLSAYTVEVKTKTVKKGR